MDLELAGDASGLAALAPQRNSGPITVLDVALLSHPNNVIVAGTRKGLPMG